MACRVQRGGWQRVGVRRVILRWNTWRQAVQPPSRGKFSPATDVNVYPLTVGHLSAAADTATRTLGLPVVGHGQRSVVSLSNLPSRSARGEDDDFGRVFVLPQRGVLMCIFQRFQGTRRLLLR